MNIFGISSLIIVLGLLGYVWKLRNKIVNLIPGKKDDEVLDVIEGAADQLGVDMDELAKKSRGRLKKKFKEKSS